MIKYYIILQRDLLHLDANVYVLPMSTHVVPPTDSPADTDNKKMASNSYINPAHMSHPDHLPDLTHEKRKSTAPAKRRRATSPDESGDSSSHPPRKHRDGPKKKKANRACAHCQKAHLTCDDCPSSLPLPDVFSLSLHSASLSTLHKARHGWKLCRGSSQKGKISPRR